MKRVAYRLAALLAAGAVSGCAINPPLRVPPLAPAGGIDLQQQVPFHPQTEYQCGPAALATVLGASGAAVTPEALAPQVYLPGRRGSLQVELIAATRRAGRIPYPIARDPEALFAELQAGRPVLVLQNLWVRTVPRWHYAVVVGADAARNRVVLNSGDRRGLRMRAPTFLRTWDWGGRWGLVTLRPGELPARADATTYLSAVADFEAVAGAEAARPAYAAARQRWPQDARVPMALGNQAHAAGDRAGAATHYRDGLALAPADPVLANNYASTMGELGCREQALAALDAIGEPPSRWREQLRRTREEVMAMQPGRTVACETLALPLR
ncbi:PA2778 family cysteine peptidase [Pseudoxanthomonas mexicana]|uniref:PA2778 family cysteine peptidase n=1 Tax=Pseudoxanthomonas mexicana TaxID=128785 RepID=UPI00398B3DAF